MEKREKMEERESRETEGRGKIKLRKMIEGRGERM